jgi:hypothetical protein
MVPQASAVLAWNGLGEAEFTFLTTCAWSISRMKPILAALVLSLTAGVAYAQPASPPANPNPSTPAVTTPHSNNAAAPASGANSFTEAQAKSRLEAAGYTSISALAKDKDGVWRGKGSKSGKALDVSLDYQGNVFPK